MFGNIVILGVLLWGAVVIWVAWNDKTPPLPPLPPGTCPKCRGTGYYAFTSREETHNYNIGSDGTRFYWGPRYTPERQTEAECWSCNKSGRIAPPYDNNPLKRKY